MSDESPREPIEVPASNDQIPPAQIPPAQNSGPHSAAVLRPLGVTVTMVLCLIFGIGGLFSGCSGVAGLMFSETVASITAAVVPQEEEQIKMQAQMQENAREMLIPNIISTVAGAAISGCLLACGLGLLSGKPWTLMLLRRTLLAGIVFECFRGVLVVWLQIKNGPIMRDFYRAMAEKGNGPDMSEMMVAFMWVGIAAWVLWGLAKIGLMIWGRFYLKGETAKDYIAQMNA
jgi:hypothetical protein